jgi:hypothetical protein
MTRLNKVVVRSEKQKLIIFLFVVMKSKLFIVTVLALVGLLYMN